MKVKPWPWANLICLSSYRASLDIGRIVLAEDK